MLCVYPNIILGTIAPTPRRPSMTIPSIKQFRSGLAWLSFALAVLSLAACTTTVPQEPGTPAEQRQEINLRSDAALERLYTNANEARDLVQRAAGVLDRKSTRLNSSHVKISYAVFCLKKKKT